MDLTIRSLLAPSVSLLDGAFRPLLLDMTTHLFSSFSRSLHSHIHLYLVHFIPQYAGAAYNHNALKETGITHIVSAARSARDNYPEDIRYLDVELCTKQMTPEEIQNILIKTSEFITEATSRKDFKVLVHDWEGAGRSAVLIVAHIMQTRRITFDAAVEIVRKTRPGINIEDAYEVQLLQLEQDMHLLPTEKQNAAAAAAAAAQGHVAGADFYDYGSEMDDVDAFDQVIKDSSSSDGFLDEFGSAEDNEYEVNSEDYEDDDGSHFWGQESYDDDEEEEESSTSIVSEESNSDEDYPEVDEDDDGSHWWGQDSYDDEEVAEDPLSIFESESGSGSSDEYWWGHVETDVGAEEAFDEGEDDDLNTFIYFEDEDDTDFIGSSDEDISVLPKE